MAFVFLGSHSSHTRSSPVSMVVEAGLSVFHVPTTGSSSVWSFRFGLAYLANGPAFVSVPAVTSGGDGASPPASDDEQPDNPHVNISIIINPAASFLIERFIVSPTI
ncbi:hypothetical protein [Bifidobacterium biavatii]|uniref:hypothetical protein n=1 Tax=Bifidobacterium biavatii TaxID=762212 RepID=UPI001269F6FD|nr:hypothetical protein [Bifidobacterium biavatii]